MKNDSLIFTTLHYVISLIFFLMILFNTVSLTRITVNMSVNNDDENAKKAKDLMILSCSLGYGGLLFILLFAVIIYIYIYNSNTHNKNMTCYEKLTGVTDNKNMHQLFEISSLSLFLLTKSINLLTRVS